MKEDGGGGRGYGEVGEGGGGWWCKGHTPSSNYWCALPHMSMSRPVVAALSVGTGAVGGACCVK